MCVYDVNGDGFNDVVTSLQAHSSAWRGSSEGRGRKDRLRPAHDFRLLDEERGRRGVFEPHGSTCADMDGDGIPIHRRQRFFSHHESYTDPIRTARRCSRVSPVRNKQAPGGAGSCPSSSTISLGRIAGARDRPQQDGVTDLVTSGAFTSSVSAPGPSRKRRRPW
jgi:hypothetical protein